MNVELLVIPDCPNTAHALALVESVLADAGLSARVVVTVISTDEEVRARQFTGSPTILIDGADPFARSDAIPGMCCRVYQTARGLAGVPDAAELSRAVDAAATRKE